MPPPPSKPALRQALKATLAAISPADRSTQSNQLAAHLLACETYQSATTILAYAALPAEIDLDPFITAALSHNKRICIPTIDWITRSMQPALIQNMDTDLESGRYGIRTPIARCPLVEPSNLDLILIPGLGFDRDFNRLGRGAGFYDRLLESLPPKGIPPTLVGVCFERQIVDHLPTEPHDHPMDRVITNTGYQQPNPRNNG